MALSDSLDSTLIASMRNKTLPEGLILRPEILLHPNIPKPLHGVAPRVVLGINWWNRTRRACYKSTDSHCLACGVHKFQAKLRQWMEAHELYEIDYAKGRAKYIEAVPLCHCCHNFIHDGRLQILLEKGEIHHSKYVTIIQHGERVLNEAGLSKPSHAERDRSIMGGELAAWGDWRLQIGWKLYPPKFKTYYQWEMAMSSKDIEE